jgi:hypothetical protein
MTKFELAAGMVDFIHWEGGDRRGESGAWRRRFCFDGSRAARAAMAEQGGQLRRDRPGSVGIAPPCVRTVSALTLSVRARFNATAPNYESGGQEFESLRARQFTRHPV